MQFTRWVNGRYFVHFLTMYLQFTHPGHQHSPPVSRVCFGVSRGKQLMGSLGVTPGPIPLGYIPAPAIIKSPVWTTPRTTCVQGPSFSHSSVGSSPQWNSDIESLILQLDLVIRITLEPMLHYDFIIFPCLCYIFRFLSHDPLTFVLSMY